jgi:hypothetical protein
LKYRRKETGNFVRSEGGTNFYIRTIDLKGHGSLNKLKVLVKIENSTENIPHKSNIKKLQQQNFFAHG